MIDPVDQRAVAHIVVLGRQGSGKGEQCGRLAARFALEHISTGDLLRAAAREGTAVGRAAEQHLVSGTPVPDDVVAGIVAERLALAGAERRGVVLDGYPRTVAQAERLSQLIEPARLDMAVHLDVPRSVAVERIQNRRVCISCNATGHDARCSVCGGVTRRRADDWPDAIGRRMCDYARELGPLLDWFEARQILVTVDGLGGPDEVERRILDAIDRHRLAVH